MRIAEKLSNYTCRFGSVPKATCFLLEREGTVYMKLRCSPNAAVDLGSGEITTFEEGRNVIPVDAGVEYALVPAKDPDAPCC
jgi:hypothetical protein